ncbi:MAG: TadG family pilus assembly protein [Deltaproteobacteria bacterium]|nr:TadG family pilus assembly protein [Deltaproteobacteria bacterium]
MLTLDLDESGATALVIAIVFAVLCGFAGLAVDIGHMVMAKAELQRTADAGALGGVTGFLPYNNPGLNQEPNWLQGQQKAHTIISNAANLAENQQFTIADGTVQYGYWLLNPPADYVQTLPLIRNANSAYLPEPAVKVTLSKNVTMYLAPLVGLSSPQTVNATATAIIPEAYQTTGVPPVAVSWDTVYDNVGGTVKIDVVEQNIKPLSNKNIAGWFNLDGGNSVPSVRIDAPLIADPTGIATGSQIYTVPGTKATLTDFITSGETIIVPIVQFVEKQGWESIIGWSAFKVDSLSANSMTGHFVDECFDPNVRPAPATTGTIGGVAGTPKLVSP